MARGDTENAFLAAALDDGIPLVRARVPWLNQRGHLGLPAQAQAAVAHLNIIFNNLGGIAEAQATKKYTPLPGDFLHVESNTFIEVDEHQHFTSFRLATLDLYPTDMPLGFDIDEYRDLCRSLASKADGYRRNKDVREFASPGRQRQRAYYDALRDLVTPAMGYPPVVRVAAPERDGRAAYQRIRHKLASLRPQG